MMHIRAAVHWTNAAIVFSRRCLGSHRYAPRHAGAKTGEKITRIEAVSRRADAKRKFRTGRALGVLSQLEEFHNKLESLSSIDDMIEHPRQTPVKPPSCLTRVRENESFGDRFTAFAGSRQSSCEP
jgi:hypothetical protein